MEQVRILPSSNVDLFLLLNSLFLCILFNININLQSITILRCRSKVSEIFLTLVSSLYSRSPSVQYIWALIFLLTIYPILLVVLTLLTPAEILPAPFQALSILFFLLSILLFFVFFQYSSSLSLFTLQLSFKLLLDLIFSLISHQSSSSPRRPPSRPPLLFNRPCYLFALLSGAILIIIFASSSPTIITECLIFS